MNRNRTWRILAVSLVLAMPFSPAPAEERSGRDAGLGMALAIGNSASRLAAPPERDALPPPRIYYVPPSAGYYPAPPPPFAYSPFRQPGFYDVPPRHRYYPVPY